MTFPPAGVRFPVNFRTDSSGWALKAHGREKRTVGILRSGRDGGKHDDGDHRRVDEPVDAVLGTDLQAAVREGLVVDGGEPVAGRAGERVFDADGEAAGKRVGGRLCLLAGRRQLLRDRVAHSSARSRS